jgi:hypothetical protein
MDIIIEPLGLVFSLYYFLICLVLRVYHIASLRYSNPTLEFTSRSFKGLNIWPVLILSSIAFSFIAAFSLILTVVLCVVTALLASGPLGGLIYSKGLGEKRLKTYRDEALKNTTTNTIVIFSSTIGSFYILLGLFMLYYAEADIIKGVALGLFVYGYVVIFGYMIQMTGRKKEISAVDGTGY